MSDIDSTTYDDTAITRALPFDGPTASGEGPLARWRAPEGFFIEKRSVGYRFAVAGEQRARAGHEWRPTQRWAKAAARRRLRQSRQGVDRAEPARDT